MLTTDMPHSIRHALLVYPYRRELNDLRFFPPLGLEFIAAVVRRHAQAVDLIDLRMEAGQTADHLRGDTDLVGFSVNWERDMEFLEQQIRAVPAGVRTIIGGRHATNDPGWWLERFPNVAAVVRGDGEEATEELCRGVPLEQIAGLSFRRDGRVVHNPNRALGPSDDALYPDRSQRRYTYAATIKDVSTGIRIDMVAGSRGCPFHCTFCSFNRNPWGQKRHWTARSPESVVDELATIEAPIVGFTDDLFTYDMDRVGRICDLLIARNIRKHYFVNARLEVSRRPDVLRKMEQAGFVMLLLGVESAQDKTLKAMQKGFDTAKIREHFEVLRHSRMMLHGYYILGCLGESRQDMLQIPGFAHELGLDTITLSMLRWSPYSGLDELVASTPGYHIAPNAKVYSDELSMSDLRQLRRQIYRQFYNVRQIGRIIRKSVQTRALSHLPTVLPHLPRIAATLAGHAWQRSRRRRARRAHAGG